MTTRYRKKDSGTTTNGPSHAPCTASSGRRNAPGPEGQNGRAQRTEAPVRIPSNKYVRETP